MVHIDTHDEAVEVIDAVFQPAGEVIKVFPVDGRDEHAGQLLDDVEIDFVGTVFQIGDFFHMIRKE